MRHLTRWSSLFALIVSVHANTEKVIFIAPQAIPLLEANPGLDSLYIDKLSPNEPTLRTALSRQFDTKHRTHGAESWFLLDGLAEGQRYELRICWAATQPTAFEIDVYNLTHVFNQPDLIQSLGLYSELRIEESRDSSKVSLRHADQKQQTILFLRVCATADYFTSNQALMQTPPPVDVDLILDPYLENIIPRSLIAILAYITLLVVASIFVSKSVWRRVLASVKQHND